MSDMVRRVVRLERQAGGGRKIRVVEAEEVIGQPREDWPKAEPGEMLIIIRRFKHPEPDEAA